jgi:hypothetical protein
MLFGIDIISSPERGIFYDRDLTFELKRKLMIQAKIGTANG